MQENKFASDTISDMYRENTRSLSDVIQADVTSSTIPEHRSQNNFLLVLFNTTLHIDLNEPRNEVLRYRALHIESR